MVLQRGGPRRGRQRCACALLWCGRSAWRAVAHARARVARSSDKCRQRPWGEKGAPPGPHQADLSACLPAGPTLTRTFRGGAGVGGIAPPPPSPHLGYSSVASVLAAAAGGSAGHGQSLPVKGTRLERAAAGHPPPPPLRQARLRTVDFPQSTRAAEAAAAAAVHGSAASSVANWWPAEKETTRAGSEWLRPSPVEPGGGDRCDGGDVLLKAAATPAEVILYIVWSSGPPPW